MADVMLAKVFLNTFPVGHRRDGQIVRNLFAKLGAKTL